MATRPRAVNSGLGYWALTAILVGLGFLGLTSVGAPIFLLGLGLLIARPFRSRPHVFWAILAGVVGFIVCFILVSPLSCRYSVPPAPVPPARPAPGPALASPGNVVRLPPKPLHTTCTDLISLHFEGEDYSPPLWPLFLVALGGAGAAGLVTSRVLRPGRRSRPVIR